MPVVSPVPAAHDRNFRFPKPKNVEVVMPEPYVEEVWFYEDDNMAGFSWRISIWVALRKTRRYSVGATWESEEPNDPTFKTYYPLKTSQQVWAAITSHLETFEEYWLDLDEDTPDDNNQLDDEDERTERIRASLMSDIVKDIVAALLPVDPVLAEEIKKNTKPRGEAEAKWL